MPAIDQALRALEALGFSHLEAEVYTALMREGPAGGYRIAQLLNRPDANVYKALKALRERGAVLENPGQRTLYRAVPFAEISFALQASLRKRAGQAESALRKLRAPQTEDWELYQITSFEHVVHKVDSLLRGAVHSVLVDAPATIVELIGEALEAAASRGVRVMAKTYEPITVPGVKTVAARPNADVLAQWSADWLNVVVDGRTSVLSLFARDDSHTVLQAMWTESRYFSWVLHSALWSEIALASLESLRERKPKESLDAALATLGAFPAPGVREGITRR